MFHTRCWSEMLAKCKFHFNSSITTAYLNTKNFVCFEFFSLSKTKISPECHRLFATRATHYDTLKVKKDCTSDEIRKSFTKLSKMVWIFIFLLCHTNRMKNKHENAINLSSITQTPAKRVVKNRIQGSFKRSWKHTESWAKSPQGKLTIWN